MSKFIVPGNPKDYYVTNKKEDGGDEFKALRDKIRELVGVYNSCIRNVISEGGDPYTANLDMNDVLNDFISSEPLGAQTEFFNIFAQEMSAATSATIDRTNKIHEENAKRELSIMQAGQWVGAIIIAIIVLAFLMR